jgi:hypothetical protein
MNRKCKARATEKPCENCFFLDFVFALLGFCSAVVVSLIPKFPTNPAALPFLQTMMLP